MQISICKGIKATKQSMKELKKLIENGENYLQYKPIHTELALWNLALRISCMGIGDQLSLAISSNTLPRCIISKNLKAGLQHSLEQ